MVRTCTTLAALLLVTGLGQAAQERPAPKQADVVKELERDFDEARARLQKDDPGAKTRAAHRRIIAGLDELLKQEDDNNSATPPAPPPALPPREPAPNEGNQPKEIKQPKENKQPMPRATPMAEPKSIPELTPAPPGKGPERPEVGPDGPWDPRRQRQQEPVDAVGRERFPPRYEELLRAYYRSLAARRGDEQTP
jgi:hypothetical protein